MANREEKIVSIQILGTEYKLKADSDIEYAQEVARYVDSKMRQIAERFNYSSQLKIAVLAALNIADELFAERANREKLGSHISRKAKSLADVLTKELA
jgi:cell division protein ZapA